METKGLGRWKGLVALLPFLYLFSSPVLYHTVSRKRVYSGQYIILTSWLACVPSPTSALWLSLPDFEGFWIKEISPIKRTTFLNIGRRGCWGYQLRTWVATPMKPGRFKIGGGKVKVVLKGRKYLLGGNFLKIRVMPVPRETMWTGSLSLETKTDLIRGKIELKVKVEGDPSLVPEPKIEIKKGEVITVGAVEEKEVKAGKLLGTKTFLYMAKGKVEGLVFSYRVFNPKRKKLLEIKTPALSIKPRLFAEEQIKPLPPSSSSLPLIFQPLYWVSASVILLLSVVFLILSLLRAKQPSSRSKIKQILSRAQKLPPRQLLEELSPWLEGELRKETDHLRFSPKIKERDLKKLLQKIKERL